MIREHLLLSSDAAPRDHRQGRRPRLLHPDLRTFSLELVTSPPVKKKKGGVETGRVSQTVHQYHYTAWPDHGVPLHALPLISFIRNSAAANGEEEPPVVVHCR